MAKSLIIASYNDDYGRDYTRPQLLCAPRSAVVRIDTVAPSEWRNFTPSGVVFGTRITCTVQVRDVASGLNTGLGYYRFQIEYRLESVGAGKGTSVRHRISAAGAVFSPCEREQAGAPCCPHPLCFPLPLRIPIRSRRIRIRSRCIRIRSRRIPIRSRRIVKSLGGLFPSPTSWKWSYKCLCVGFSTCPPPNLPLKG